MNYISGPKAPDYETWHVINGVWVLLHKITEGKIVKYYGSA